MRRNGKAAAYLRCQPHRVAGSGSSRTPRRAGGSQPVTVTTAPLPRCRPLGGSPGWERSLSGRAAPGAPQPRAVRARRAAGCSRGSRCPHGSVGGLCLFGFCFLAVSARIKEALSPAGPWSSRGQGEALSEAQAAALLPRAPAAFTCIQCLRLARCLLCSV